MLEHLAVGVLTPRTLGSSYCFPFAIETHTHTSHTLIQSSWAMENSYSYLRRCKWVGAYIIRFACTLSCLSSREILWALSMETQKWNFLLLITFYFWPPNGGAEQTKQFRQDKGEILLLQIAFHAIWLRLSNRILVFCFLFSVFFFCPGILWQAFRLLSPQTCELDFKSAFGK